ncbi:MAG: calcium-translocating P-type ATPase, PMCA-type [Acidaminococcus sp.]|nr:calcium-translocating P-type ATPase, PMCA-type [Acidaminococcus sp.]MDY4559912.1 calcium-translocating P-type ATPase, PMCA-type [Eubacteriales bacterium]MDY5345339.1 calcium-translocating P-type ATPase, PMCA-type [Eubacteriales bacterium]
MKFYDVVANSVIEEVKTSAESGLTAAEASERLSQNGKNELDQGKKKSIFVKFLEQFKDAMIIVLLCAAIISSIISIVEKQYYDLIDAGLILLIVIVNAIIGVTQEAKAEAALDALKNMNKPFCKVIRDGEMIKIKSEELVVGDLVVLEAGDIVPADIRLIEAMSLKVEESALTGESVPSEKDAEIVCDTDAPLGDRKNMVYSSGVVSYGRGKGVVVATGMGTEVGKIAKMLGEHDDQQTPLQVQLAKTAKVLSIIILAIAAIIFVAKICMSIGGETPMADTIIGSFMTAVAIAVAAIPEGLPAVVTIVLAIGVQRMSEKRAIIRNLPAVETLGCCEVICSDKTGTLTLNQMTVKDLYTTSAKSYEVDNENKKDDYSVDMLIKGMTLCNDTIVSDGKLHGDPTETALVAYARLIGYDSEDMIKSNPRIDEIPFDSKRKLMSTVHQTSDGKIAFIKGAPDILIERCTEILDGDKIRKITADDVKNIKAANSKMAHKALRVLAVALKKSELSAEKLESNMVFVGLVGMIDPPRPEVKEAVKVCKRAGMRPIMITGDHIDTASAIAEQIGILRKGDWVITGAELDKLSDEEFHKNLHKYRVFARVSPENKVRIVKAFKSFKKICAMTGDGVNDAPSIKAADIGIGMGITGTDVSKGAADMVLADDNFATIIAAVEEGRKVYSNITKAIQFLLSANIAEVLCLFIATVFLSIGVKGGVEFLSPVMILWVNLVTDSLPALALGMEPAEKDIMNYPPRKTGKSMFSGKIGRDILIQGVVQTGLVMLAYCIGSYVMEGAHQALDHKEGMTMAFITLSFIQLFHAYNMRSQTHTIFNKKLLKNKMMNISFIVGVILMVLAVNLDTWIPGEIEIFGTTQINAVDWVICIACAFSIIPAVEIQKLIENAIKKSKAKKANDAELSEEEILVKLDSDFDNAMIEYLNSKGGKVEYEEDAEKVEEPTKNDTKNEK